MAIIGKRNGNKYYDKNYEVNYYNVRNTAWDFLLKNNVISFPLDIKTILQNNHWKLLTYDTYSKLNNISMKELKKISTDGFVDIDQNDDYIIVVNQENSLQRRRFTICHEIGHIVLHKIFLDIKKLEKEANMFASRILMPMLLIKELEIKTKEDLSKICNVSLQSAEIRMKRFNKIKGRERFYTNPLEKELLEQLQPFIQKHKKENK